MKTNRPIAFLSILFLFISCQKEKNTNNNFIKQDTTQHYTIGNYMIVPKLKEVRTLRAIGGKDWDGIAFEKDSSISYNKTTLLLIGDNVFFKEYFPFNFNIDKLKVIYKDDFYFFIKDDQYIYGISKNLKPAKINISGYKPVNDFIYKSKNKALFFLNIEGFKLTPIGIDIDENSIKHLSGNYYYDKNGLYFFGEHYKKNIKGHDNDYLAKSEKLIDKPNVTPIISKKYISFNNQVFAIDNYKIKKLDIDAKKIIEVSIGSSESFITDGKTIYSDMQYGYDDDNRNEKGYYGEEYPKLYSGINLQKIYSPLLHFNKENTSVVFNKNYPDNFPGLIAMIDNEHYLLSNKKKMKIDKMMFYHPETKTNEIFDEKYLKIYGINGFIQYKNVLYYNGVPVETSKFDMENMRQIENSNYLTDGKSLLYIGDIYEYSSIEKKEIEYANFYKGIIENAFTKEMKVISPDLLSDGITLIYREQKIKIKDLNLNVKIIE